MKKILALFMTILATVIFSGTLQASAGLSTSLSHKVIRQIANRQLTPDNHPSFFVNEALAKHYRSVLFDRFLKYVTYNSQSSYTEEITPDQIETAQKLYNEIKTLGYPQAQLSEHHYIFVKIPSNLPKGQTAPILGFSAHYDVTPDVTTNNVHAQVINNYRGNKIDLGLNPKGEPQALDPNTKRDAYLKTQIGKTIVTSDGTTNLGADDRAGMSILITLLQVLAENPNRPHGEIQIVIAPNEETGGAADYITEVPYRPEIAFDFDGSVDGELMVNNFNALQVLVTVKGHEGHQSNADGTYINHGLAAADLVKQVYEDPSIPRRFAGNSIVNPQSTNGHWLRLPTESRNMEGYLDVFLQRPANDVTIVDFRARSFAQADLDQIEQFIREITDFLAVKYYDPQTERKVTFSIETRSTYNNVGETAHPASLEVARAAFAGAGVNMRPVSERAGTTGAIFVAATKNEEEKIVGSFMLLTGQNNMHSYVEWLSEEDMFRGFWIGLNIVDQVVLLGNNK